MSNIPAHQFRGHTAAAGGFGEVFDDWDEKYAWMQSFKG